MMEGFLPELSAEVLPGRAADQEDLVRSSQLFIYSEVNSRTSKVCVLSHQEQTTTFPPVVLGASRHHAVEDGHRETIPSAQALAMNRHLDVTCIKDNK